MNDFLDELASMELSDGETREVLRRLAHDEFQVSARTRLSDISELTGVPVDAIGRMVADIRGEAWSDWRTRIESTLAIHSVRIDSVEGRPTTVLAPIDDRELFDRVERGRAARMRERPAFLPEPLEQALVILFLLILVVIGWAVLTKF